MHSLSVPLSTLHLHGLPQRSTLETELRVKYKGVLGFKSDCRAGSSYFSTVGSRVSVFCVLKYLLFFSGNASSCQQFFILRRFYTFTTMASFIAEVLITCFFFLLPIPLRISIISEIFWAFVLADRAKLVKFANSFKLRSCWAHS